MNKQHATQLHDLHHVAQQFLSNEQCDSIAPYGKGHINDTFIVETCENNTTRTYVLQRINTDVFTAPDIMMDNIVRVTTHIRKKITQDVDAHFIPLEPLPVQNDGWIHTDTSGNVWRMYHFVENTYSIDVAKTPHHAYEAARIFGLFQSFLIDLPAPRLHDTIPEFHNTEARVQQLLSAIDSASAKRKDTAHAEIDWAIKRKDMSAVLPALLAQRDIPERITHNDTKLNNVLFDKEKDTAISVVDLDTVMPGLALYDFGDSVRTTTCAAPEDETNLSRVHMDMSLFQALVKGYLSSAHHFLTEAEIAHLAFSGKLIAYEIGIRFLADYLNNDVYFKTQRPEHNLDRARVQFALVNSIEKQYNDMQKCVEEVRQ